MKIVITAVASLIFSCSRIIGINRSYRILHEIHNKYKSYTQFILQHFLLRELPDRLLKYDFIEKYLHNDFNPKKTWPIAITNNSVLESIHSIPSETTAEERKFLYKFFSEFWDGQGNVLEIGPFLGGTTRAIGKGMIENPKLHTNSRLYTTDRFSLYYDKDRLSNLLQPLFNNGTLKQSDFNFEENPKCKFQDIFRKIHISEDYYKLVEIIDEILPDLKEQLNYGEKFLELNEMSKFSVFFIDGCKSWFSTKYFFLTASESSQIGAFYIFQDYGWMTCFWLPMCLHLLRDNFKLISYIDATYTFQLTNPLDAEKIERIIPDTPNDISIDKTQAIFNDLLKDASIRNDNRASILLSLQHAAALAYRNDLKQAKKIIIETENKEFADDFKNYIEISKKTPTYVPRLLEDNSIVSDMITL